MRPLAGLGLAMLAACGVPAESEADTASVEAANAGETNEAAEPVAAPPRSQGEALITRYTWVGPGQRAPKGTYAPRDDCGELQGAYAFRTALADAVVARDVDAMVALADPEIKLDFGGAGGHEEFRRELSEPGWNLWPALEALLPLGCAVNSRDGITLPWYFAQDFGDLDSFSAMIVLGEDVPLRAAAGAESRVLTRLSWDTVELDLDEFDGELGPVARVKARDGTVGYVASENLRSLIDYRLIAERSDGQWKITAFVAGD